MNIELQDILNQIVAEQSDTILSEPKRVSSFLSDLAREVPKPQKTALIKSLEHGFAKTLKDVPAPERNTCKQKLAQKLNEEEGLELKLCEETLELLAAVLFSEKQKKKDNLCKNCGKELQKEWTICPYCRTEVENTSSPSNETALQKLSLADNSDKLGNNLKISLFSKRTILAIGIGVSLVFVFNRFVNISTFDFFSSYGIIILSVFSAIFGPVAGFLIGFISDILFYLSWGAGELWIWAVFSALYGLGVGAFWKYYKVESGEFRMKQAFIFNCIQILTNIIVWVVIFPIFSNLIGYTFNLMDHIKRASFESALGTLLLFGYTKIITKVRNLKK